MNFLNTMRQLLSNGSGVDEIDTQGMSIWKLMS